MKELIVEVKIESLNKEAKGVGSFFDLAGNQKEALVSFTMPNDVVDVSLKQRKRGVYPGKLLQVVQEAPNRVKPRCAHFGLCGGCRLQHVPYEEQLTFKQNLVAKWFSTMGKPLPILPSENIWAYRNKMEFSFSQDKAGNRYLGMFAEGSRGKVFNLEECHLVSPWFAEVLEKVRAWWSSTELLAFFPPASRGTLRTITLRESLTTKERLVMLTVSGDPVYALHKPDLQSFMDLFDEELFSVYLRVHQAIKGQPTEFFEMHLKGKETIKEMIKVKTPVHFEISPSAFFQPNTHQAMVLYSKALELAKLDKDDVVYDLYCGTGTLGLLAAPYVKSVLGIELSAESSLDARENAKRNQVDNIEILTGSVGDVLKQKGEREAPSIILLDPPRSGLDSQSLNEVLSLKCKKIVYISCNPETQSRDALELINAGYVLDALQPVDQFPHTPHIENIAVFLLHSQN